MLAAVLALLASVSWGTSDFVAGVEARRSTAWTAALGGQVVASLSLVALLLATSSASLSPAALAPAAVGGAVGGFGVVLQYRALALLDMGVVSPIIAGAALVPVVWGTIAGERPGTLQMVGIACALVGIVLISRRERARAPSPHTRRGILYAALSATALGLFLVALDLGGRSDPLLTVATARTAAALTLLVVAACARPAISLYARALPALLLIGLLIAAANLLFTSATTHGDLAVVGVLGWLNPAVTMAWAVGMLQERLGALQVLAAVLVFAGVVCITLG